MWLLDYSLDNLSLMALTLSVGFVVDDAIVMLENIVRHMEMGKTRMQASLDGSKEISFTIVSMTLSLAAVFIPVLFMGGIVGRLMHEFAVTIAASILVSGLVSLTLTPMLCSRFLKPLHGGHHGRFYNVIERMFEASLRWYGWTLRQTIRFKALTMAVSVRPAGRAPSTCSGSIPKGFIPSVDTGQLNGQIEAIQGIGYESMVGHVKQIMDILSKDPNVQAFTANVGGPGARLNVDLKPRDQRTLTADQIIDELRPKLARVPGVRVFLHEPAGDPHRRLPEPQPVPVHAAGSGHRRAVPGRLRSSRPPSTTSRASRTSIQTCRSRTRRSPSTSIASRSRRSVSPSIRSNPR